jgi:hypothetical protein
LEIYNLCYTALPIIVYSLMDEEYPNSTNIKVFFLINNIN